MFFLKHLWDYDSLLGSNNNSKYEQQIGFLTSLPKVSPSDQSLGSQLQDNTMTMSGLGVSTMALDSSSVVSSTTRKEDQSVVTEDVDELRAAEIQRAYEKHLEAKKFKMLSEKKRKEAKELARHRKLLEQKEEDLRAREERLQGMLDEYKNARRGKYVRQIPSLPLTTTSSEKSVIQIPEPVKLVPSAEKPSRSERAAKVEVVEKRERKPVRPPPKVRAKPWRTSPTRLKRNASKKKCEGEEEVRAAIKLQR